MSRPRSNNRGDFSASGGQDAMKLRKELIQAKSRIADLQSELQDKTHAYMEVVKQKENAERKLQGDRQSRADFGQRVSDKVTEALQAERSNMKRAERDAEILRSENRRLEDENHRLHEKERQLQDLIDQKNRDAELIGGLNNDEALRRLDQVRKEKEAKEEHITKLLKQMNTLSNQMEDIIVENHTLRTMAGVPENFGIDLDQIKLHDREKIHDFKKLIKVLQDDNYKLEEERATLKNQMRQMSMIYKMSDPSERYREGKLDAGQLFKLDQYAVSLISGTDAAYGSHSQLQRELAEAKKELELLRMRGLDIDAIKKLMSGTSEFKSGDIQRLLRDNQEFRELLERLLQQGISGGSGKTTFYPGKNQPPVPLPNMAYDGSIAGIDAGKSLKFNNSRMVVHDDDGNVGMDKANLYECAFYQLQLQECFEIIKRKDSEIKSQENTISQQHARLVDYLLTQDQLYRDYVRVERHANDEVKEHKTRLAKVEHTVMKAHEANHNLETTIKALQTSDQQSLKNKLIDLTKKNSILEGNLMTLTKKYTTMKEHETMLLRLIHSQDEDMAEKDRFVQQRINQLKEWKAKAILQLKLLFNKLRKAVPISEYSTAKKELEVSEQRKNDAMIRNSKLSQRISKLQNEVRANLEAEEKLKDMTEIKDECEEELEIIKKRLEHFDPAFKWENEVFMKITTVLGRAQVSLQQAFEEFDDSGDGLLQRDEFFRCLQKLRVNDLTNKELDILWASLDTDRSGSIDYKEFSRKLARHGFRNRSREEMIIYQIVEAVNKSKVQSLANLFQLMDKHGRGVVTKEDFTGLFRSLKLNINENELSRFTENFWQDKSAGIDYKQFLRIFSRYQIRLDQEKLSKEKGYRPVSDAVIEKKKEAYDAMAAGLRGVGKTLQDLFSRVDIDNSKAIDRRELHEMFKGMKLDASIGLTPQDSAQIFDSIDFDGSGSVSLPELQADFNTVVGTTLQDLKLEERHKRRVAQKVNETHEFSGAGAGAMGGQDQQELRLQTKIEILAAREKQLLKKLETTLSVLHHSEQSIQVLQREYDELEKVAERHQVDKLTFQDRIIILEKNAANSVLKSEEDDLQMKNETLLYDLTATRAAMLSYKNMCMVIADQVKSIQLNAGRKKNEYEDMMTAIRDMQAEGSSKERLGKLYFVIMLSRWQEAAVNKKYEMVLQEVKEQRAEVMNLSQLGAVKDQENAGLQTSLGELEFHAEKLRQLAHKNTGAYLSQEDAARVNSRVEDVLEEKTELEEKYFALWHEASTGKESADIYRAKLDTKDQLLKDLANSRPSELSNKLIEMSERLEKVTIQAYRGTRQSSDHAEKNEYLRKMLKGHKDSIAALEDKAAKCEAEMFRQEEEFRRRDNERLQEFFYKDNLGLDRAFAAPQNTAQAQQARRGDINRAAQMTDMQPSGINVNAHDVNAFVQSRIDPTHGGLQPAAFGSDQDQRIKSLEEDIKKLGLENRIKDQELKQLKQWQLGDKYLNREEHLSDAIGEGMIEISKVQNDENKEIADAAYQTVKTLQDLLDKKNDVLRQKETHIAELREKMMQQREQDALEITKLREQLSATGNSTLNKMHEIVTKNQIGGSGDVGRAKVSKARADRMNLEQLQNALDTKDTQIMNLTREKTNLMREKEHLAKTRDDKGDQIRRLEEELKREKNRVDIKSAHKKLLRLQKDLDEKNSNITKLNKCIDTFKDRMIKLNSDALGLEETNDITKKRAELDDATLRKKMEQLDNKRQLALSARDVAQAECTDLKERVGNMDAELLKLKSESKALNVELEKNRAELLDERTHRNRLQNEVDRFSGNNKVGQDYDALDARVKELAQENAVLQASARPVVVYNRQQGSFEYIGEPMLLDVSTASPNLRQFFAKTDAWIKRNDRLTVKTIFQSFDRGNFGELTMDQVNQAFNRVGIRLHSAEQNMLKDKLDDRSIGYMKLDPLLRRLQGIPVATFLTDEMKLVADSVLRQNLTKRNFQEKLDKQVRGLPVDQFKRALAGVVDFKITEEQHTKILNDVLGTSQSGGLLSSNDKRTVSTTEFVDQVFYTVQAVLIERYCDQIKRSENSFANCMVKRDTNNDGYLEYEQVETLLMDDMKVTSYARGTPCVDNIFSGVLIDMILDPAGQRRRGKVSFDVLKFYLGSDFNQVEAQTTLDLVPQQEGQADVASAGNPRQMNAEQLQIFRKAARKVLSACGAQLYDIIGALDKYDEGNAPCQQVIRVLKERKIPSLTEKELEFVVEQCDRGRTGCVVTNRFVQKLQEMASETEAETKLKRFAMAVTNQGLDLKKELLKYDVHRSGLLDLPYFRKCLKQMPTATNDAEIESLFNTHAQRGPKRVMNITSFVNTVRAAANAPSIPQFTTATTQSNLLPPTRNGAGAKSGQQQSVETWEIERKYKRTLEALKNEIQEKNEEVQRYRNQVDDMKVRAHKLEKEVAHFENLAVKKNDKPPAQMKKESTDMGELNTIQDLLDQIFQLNKVIDEQKRTINVDLKSEYGRLREEKDKLQDKLNTLNDLFRKKEHELESLRGRPMDAVARREEAEYARHNQIMWLEEQLEKSEQQKKDLENEMFNQRDKLLDLKFEKETFDLQYARLQKRVTDLETYKMQSSKLSAEMKERQEEEVAKIRETASKMAGEVVTKRANGSNTLRKKPSKTSAELESVVETLRRVVDKQKEENAALKRRNQRLEEQADSFKGSDVPALKQRIEQLERIRTQYELMKDTDASMGQDLTIKKLIFANRQLREDLSREIERYNLLEKEYKNKLVETNILKRENTTNKGLVFGAATGANINNYDKFLETKDKKFDELDYNDSTKVKRNSPAKPSKKTKDLDTYLNEDSDGSMNDYLKW